jgi:deoxyribodipyrimidine photolyase
MSTAPGIRRAVLWFRNDLRVHDSAIVHRAGALAAAGAEVLPVYCFDPRHLQPRALEPFRRRLVHSINDSPYYAYTQLLLSGAWVTLPLLSLARHFAAETKYGSPKMSPRRAKFLVECVQDLRTRLRALGSDQPRAVESSR